MVSIVGHTIGLSSTLKTLGIILCGHNVCQPTILASCVHVVGCNIFIGSKRMCILKVSNIRVEDGYIMNVWHMLLGCTLFSCVMVYIAGYCTMGVHIISHTIQVPTLFITLNVHIIHLI